MKRNLFDVARQRQQSAQIPGVEWWMRMPPHVHHLSHEDVACVVGMQRIQLRVLGARQIIDVVALNRLIQERQPDRQNRKDNPQTSAQATRIC